MLSGRRLSKSGREETVVVAESAENAQSFVFFLFVRMTKKNGME